jgi:hypothetical protein
MSEGFSWHRLRPLVAPARRLGAATLLVIVLTAAFAVWSARPAIRALMTGRAVPVDAAAPADDLQDALAADMRLHASRIDGRSLFFIPPPPRRPEPEIVRAPDGPPPPPSRYGGPPLIAMVNDSAWFSDGTRLRLGDQPPPGSQVRLIALSPPWSARIEWKGVEFDVSLFDRNPAPSSASVSLSAPSRPDGGAPPRRSGRDTPASGPQPADQPGPGDAPSPPPPAPAVDPPAHPDPPTPEPAPPEPQPQPSTPPANPPGGEPPAPEPQPRPESR